MFSNIKSNISTWVKGSLGWKTNRKIVVFESDDWGSIRMPSNKTFDALVSKGIKLDSAGGYLFNKYDTLANEDDLTALFEVLNSVRDKNNNPAVFTAISVVANPDFDKIASSGFQEYHYEPFTKTLEKYQSHNRTFDVWKEGIRNKLFVPQSHSREHLNVLLWMENLRKGDIQTKIAFDHGIWGYDRTDNQPSYQVAFSIKSLEDLKQQAVIVKESLDIFENLFGFKSSFFVPPNGLFHPSLEKVTSKMGVSLLYGSFIYHVPTPAYGSKKTIRYLGQSNTYGQKYVLRNCQFEPNDPEVDWLSVALKDIETAFKYNKPAILGPHRKNFIGSLDESNRTKSLIILRNLLKEIIKRWPDVEFLSTAELFKINK